MGKNINHGNCPLRAWASCGLAGICGWKLHPHTCQQCIDESWRIRKSEVDSRERLFHAHVMPKTRIKNQVATLLQPVRQHGLQLLHVKGFDQKTVHAGGQTFLPVFLKSIGGQGVCAG